MSNARSTIIETFARWTALSALRSGAPVKSRGAVYTALDGVEFSDFFKDSSKPVDRIWFNQWHERATHQMRSRERRLNVGWATKILNVYL